MQENERLEMHDLEFGEVLENITCSGGAVLGLNVSACQEEGLADATYISFKPPQSCVLTFDADACDKTAAQGWITRKKQPSVVKERLLTEIEAVPELCADLKMG